MKHIYVTIFFYFLLFSSYSQFILNGDFENNSASTCIWNMSNSFFNSKVSDVWAYGNANEVDIQTTSCGYAVPQSGLWFVSLNSQGINTKRDEISLKLSSSLVAGKNYVISYFEKRDSTYVFGLDSLVIGVSSSPTSFGVPIYQSLPPLDSWKKRTFMFSAPFNANYITVKCKGKINGWNLIDNFYFDTCEVVSSLGNDTSMCLGDTLTLGVSTYNSSYLWSDGSTEPTFRVYKEGKYFVQIDNGCIVHFDTILVKFVPCELELLIPNVFSPNLDGINDFFFIKFNYEPVFFNIDILNRWGEVIFQSADPFFQWNGKCYNQNCSEGTYYYLIKCTDAFDKKRFYKGSITLVR